MRLGRGTPLVTSGGATTRLPRPVEGSRPGRPRLGRTRVTKHKQHWAERRPGCRDWWREADQEGPGWAGPELRSTSSVGQRCGELDASECLQVRLRAACCGRGVELPWGGDDPATEIGRGKPTGKAPAGPDRSYKAQAELGRGKESRAPVSDSG
ncbi:hypothetical protein NDU88_008562 [Pleurodeles waltl]|uniref:Uncharacterized protein n=1 Tax=Pleurodeles waltl TaxID=8319 RepID=A0AAV7QV24_PLEWA|nr:hypothetical protein NDU88_008562 [Pleurodeles waltl]